MTPEGVDLVAQWVLLLLICYGVIAITFYLATFLLRWLWWLLKVGVALACFGLILKDHHVGIETTAMRLVCLGGVCILTSIKPWKDRAMAAKTVHLEEQLKILEYRGREMEGWRRRFITLSCCVIGFLCLVFFIVFRIYIVMSNHVKSWALFSLWGFRNFREEKVHFEKLNNWFLIKGATFFISFNATLVPALNTINTFWILSY